MPHLNARRVASIVAAAWLSLAALPVAQARAAQPTEYEVKAVFLFNFSQFVAWPPAAFASTESPLTICVLGTDPFGAALDDVIRGETVNGRPLTARRCRSVDDTQGCHILFIAGSERNRLGPILTQLRGRSILTVGDVDRFAHRGGVIGLVKAGNKIRLHVNLDAARAADLTISSKLLRPAQIVASSGGSR